MALRALLGRTRELAHLQTALDQAVAGRGSVFLLSGARDR
jgi:predicted ATPase